MKKWFLSILMSNPLETSEVKHIYICLLVICIWPNLEVASSAGKNPSKKREWHSIGKKQGFWGQPLLECWKCGVSSVIRDRLTFEKI